jgi:hypothetical protein
VKKGKGDTGAKFDRGEEPPHLRIEEGQLRLLFGLRPGQQSKLYLL